MYIFEIFHFAIGPIPLSLECHEPLSLINWSNLGSFAWLASWSRHKVTHFLYMIRCEESVLVESLFQLEEYNPPRSCCGCCCCCWFASIVSNSVRPHRQQPTRLPCPWNSPGKNTGVGCPSLLQCMKVKSESEVAESCLTLSDPMDCSLPGSSVHGIFQARVLEWDAIAFSVQGVAYLLMKTFTSSTSNPLKILSRPIRIGTSPCLKI